jgi:ParB-like chromosome segregation protein Spo0J
VTTIFDSWPAGEVRAVPLASIGERYRRYRLSSPEAEEEMVRSLRRWGQLAPITIWVRDELAEVLDGFKRLSAARQIAELKSLAARRLEVDERGAKAAIYGLNQVGRHLAELEEAWIVFALVREDGLSQVEAASLLGRHKSWVHRRLALLERLGEEAQEDLRLGLLSVTAARQLVRLPTGNQAEVLGVLRREQLSARELAGTVDLLLASATREKEAYILADPRRALRQAQGFSLPSWDPRLSTAANRASKQLGALLDGLSRMENWLRHRGRADLTASDARVLRPAFQKLGAQCRLLAELAEDLVAALAGRDGRD